MDAGDLCDVLIAHKDRMDEEKIFLRYDIASGVMEGVTGSGISLQEYKRLLRRPDTRSAKEIIKEVEGYIEEFNTRGLRPVEVLDGII